MPVADKRILAVRVPPETVEAIDAARGSMSRARWVEQAINDALMGDTADDQPKAITVPKEVLASRLSDQTARCDHPRARVIKGFCYKCGSLVLPK